MITLERSTASFVFILLLPLVSEMTYTVSSGTLNSSIPYHTILLPLLSTTQPSWVLTWFPTLTVTQLSLAHRPQVVLITEP